MTEPYYSDDAVTLYQQTKRTKDMHLDANSKAIAKTLELLTDRFDAGELKPRQFEMVVRELMRTVVYTRKWVLHAD